jgi:hypothetical protein
MLKKKKEDRPLIVNLIDYFHKANVPMKSLMPKALKGHNPLSEEPPTSNSKGKISSL